MALPTKIDFDKIDKIGSDGLKVSKSVRNLIGKGRGSIAALAKENIFEYPVFIADSVQLDYATAVSSLLEQLYASFLQTGISMNPVVSKQTAELGRQFEKFKTDTNRYLEHTDMPYSHDACHAEYVGEGYVVEFNLMTIDDYEAKIINEYCEYEPLSEFDHFFTEAKRIGPDYESKTEKDGDFTYKTPSEAEKDKLDEDTKSVALGSKIKRKQLRDYDEDRKISKERHAVDTKVKAPQYLDESKIQKLNTMKPLMMVVNLRITNEGTGVSEPVEYIIGVKTRIHLIDADILPEVAEYPIKEMNKISRKVKWKAGELKFFRDIVFKIKQKKQTAIDSRDPRRKWYRRLYELANTTGNVAVAGAHRRAGSKDFSTIFVNPESGLIPNATIVVSKIDIDNIKREKDIDLLNGATAKKFCKDLFLISFVVVDTDAESIKMMIPDLHDSFEIHSMASVTKQLSMLDSSGIKTRDIAKLLS